MQGDRRMRRARENVREIHGGVARRMFRGGRLKFPAEQTRSLGTPIFHPTGQVHSLVIPNLSETAKAIAL